MRGRVFYIVAGAFTGGIFIRSFFIVDIHGIALLALIAVSAAGFGYMKRLGFGTPLMLASVAILVCALGMLRYDASTWGARHTALDGYLEHDVVLEGVVRTEPDIRERTAHITIDVSAADGSPISGRVLVVADRFTEVAYGDSVAVRGTLEKPESFETDLGRTFDYPGYLSARGIHHTLSFADIEVRESGGGNPVVRHLLSVKHAFMRSIEATIPEPQVGLGEGLLLGAKRALGEQLENAFRATGIIHIVVLSGYNMTIVAEAVMRLLAAFFTPRVRFVLGAATIVSFAVLVGLSATVVRASIMALLVLVARATGKTYAVMRALVISALIMLLVNPLLLVFDPGFQLSFLATFGLILLAPLIEKRLSLVPTKFQVREFITATVATQLFVLPLLLYSIGEFSLVAVPVNVLVLVAVPLAMLLTFLTGLVGFVSTMLALPFAYASHLVLGYIITVVVWFADLPYASVIVPAFPFWVVIAAYGVLVYGLYRGLQGGKILTKNKFISY